MKSYFIDTNFFLRLLLKDNERQFKKVYGLFQKAIKGEIKIFTSVVVFFEIYWVLSSFHKRNKPKNINCLEKILKMEFLEIENKATLTKALVLFKQFSLELEDCYNIAFFRQYSLSEFATFDKKILKII
jgi:predicted nucleic acid-binding protein